MNKRVKILLYLLFPLFFYSCITEGGGEVSIERVLMVYFAGDNNLSGEVPQKIEAIRKGWDANGKYRILIYRDMMNAEPELLEIVREEGVNVLNVLRTYPEENSANKTVFSRAISEMLELYDASSYGLLLFSHASGWLPKGTLLKPRSVFMDGQNEMELTDFAEAIPDGVFDCIALEACFMAGIEVAYELRNKADYLLASSAEILSPGFTDVYASGINHVLHGNLPGFAQEVVDSINAKPNLSERSATFSVIKTAALSDLAYWVKMNCDLNKAVNVRDIQYFDRNPHHLFFDFEDYFALLLETEEQRDELKRLVDACVVWKAATPSFLSGYSGFEIKKHSGLTTYIPQQSYPYLNTEYLNLDWHSATME